MKKILIYSFFAVLIFLAFFLFLHKQNVFFKKDITASSTPVGKIARKETSGIPNGYVKYQNNKYSFILYHPPEIEINEMDEEQGAMVITLENEKEALGFQIFIVPYWNREITDERFKLDVPSNIRNNIKKSSIDGVEAVEFDSRDDVIGETKEIWFIRGGYLYEVTAPKEAGNLLDSVMQNWKFL